MYAFRFSIDGHKLKAMATDGYLVDPVEVDYIAIHSGERYDFLLEANQGSGDFWMKAETFEIDVGNSKAPPYSFYEHKAEAILHYYGSEAPNATEYGNISHTQRQCTAKSLCRMLNCPFGHFHPSYNITCVSIDNLRLYSATPRSEMPSKTPDVTYFMNMGGFVSPEQPISSINDKNFLFPTYPLTTLGDKNNESIFCEVNSECERDGGCQCTTVVDIGYNKTVRFVVSGVGEERNSTHSIHIHGHSVHVLKVGHGQYSSENGSLLGSSRDLTCTKDGDDWNILDENRCPNPRFRSPDTTFPIGQFTVRKDTFIVPAGGYVVVQFRSDNPGFWFMHCHVNLHQREGMVLIIREAMDKITREMKTCGTFQWDINDFLKSFESGGVSAELNILGLLLLVSSAIALVY